MKGMAFLAAGNVVHQTGERNIKNMQGLVKAMPATTIALSIALLGLGGVPGTNGFISKFVLLSSSIGAGMPILAVIGIINVAISMAYYLRVIMTLVIGSGAKALAAKEAPMLMVGIVSLMAILIVILGIYPNPILRPASDASKSLIEGLGNYIGAVIK
jgi:multicomponent Na+:H+ antiporter subunit D